MTCLASKIKVSKGIIYVKKINSYDFNVCNHMFHPYSIPSKSLLPSHLKPHDFPSQNELINVWVQIWHLFHVCGITIEWKLNSLGSSSDYSPYYLSMNIYELTESVIYFSSISAECTYIIPLVYTFILLASIICQPFKCRNQVWAQIEKLICR